MSTQTVTRSTSVAHVPVGARVLSLPMIAGLTVLLAALIAVMVWAIPRGGDVLDGYSRGEIAAIQRLQGQAAEYEQRALQRGYRADAARWAAQADFYEQVRQARSDAASTARLEGQAREWLLRQLSPADRAAALRLEGLADRYLDR